MEEPRLPWPLPENQLNTPVCMSLCYQSLTALTPLIYFPYIIALYDITVPYSCLA